MMRICVRDFLFACLAAIWLGTFACGGRETLGDAGEDGASTNGTGGIAAVNSDGRGGAGGAAVVSSGASGGSGGACGSSGANCRPRPPCPTGWFVNDDMICPYSPTSSPPCYESGSSDGLCYHRCTTDSDCTDSVFSVCGSISLYDDSDYLHSVGVCEGGQYVAGCPDPHRG